MEKVTYEKEITALLVIDPYNDFISEGGKIWDRLKGVAEANKCVPNMLQVVIGLIAHTCVEATVRFAAELSYEVTMVKDATVDYGDEEMHAALDVNIPAYASAIVTTTEIVASLSSV
jgi:nicotinamidase-related amidase